MSFTWSFTLPPSWSFTLPPSWSFTLHDHSLYPLHDYIHLWPYCVRITYTVRSCGTYTLFPIYYVIINVTSASPSISCLPRVYSVHCTLCNSEHYIVYIVHVKNNRTWFARVSDVTASCHSLPRDPGLTTHTHTIHYYSAAVVVVNSMYYTLYSV